MVTNKWREIVNEPTVIDGVHESIYRCRAILDKAMNYLKRGMPGELVVEIVEEMQEFESIEKHLVKHEDEDG